MQTRPVFRYFPLLVLVMVTPRLFAQQGIGTEQPNRSSALEILSPKRGVLIPRVELIAQNDPSPVDQPANSLLIYNTATSDSGISEENKVTPGYYYWLEADHKWHRLLADLDANHLRIEPWQVQGTNNKATENDQNIYQEGKVAIGKTADFIAEATLDVKGAIRGGDPDRGATVGTNSLAVGEGVIAGGENTFATGKDNEASREGAVVVGGYNNTASGIGSVVIGGENNRAEGSGSFVFAGLGNTAKGVSIVAGLNNTADGFGSFVYGADNQVAGGQMNLIYGDRNQISGNSDERYVLGKNNHLLGNNNHFNFVFGVGNRVSYGYATVLGVNNAITGESPESGRKAIFQLANGTVSSPDYERESGHSHNALTVLDNDFTGIGIIGQGNDAKPTEMLHIGTSESSSNPNKVRIEDLPHTEGSAVDRTVVVDENGILHSIAAVKASLPEFFYMPSIIIPTSEAQLNAPGSGRTSEDDFDDSTREGTISLYRRYAEQFGTGMAKNTGATTTLPVLPADELDYHVTWYDTEVFEDVSVNDSGVMEYKVKNEADIHMGSFMNIVFAVK